ARRSSRRRGAPSSSRRPAEGAGCGGDDDLSVGAGEDGGPLVGVVADGPFAFVDKGVVVLAEGDTAVEVGFPVMVPWDAVVDIRDAVAAAWKGTPASPSEANGTTLRGVPVAGFAAHVQHLACSP